MKYCANYSNKIKLDSFDEISIIYNGQFSELIKFIQEHKEQKINVVIEDFNAFYDKKEWDKLNMLYTQEGISNFVICLTQQRPFSELTIEMQEVIGKLDMPYFTGHYVTNFEQLDYLLNKGVDSVYLVEDICFDLKRAKQICDNYGAQIRVFPNIAQSCIRSTEPLKKFFIRPEDLREYSDVVDIIEFQGPLDRQAVLQHIYQKGIWYGDLSVIVLDLNLSIDSNRLLPFFGKLRKDCERKCIKGHSCTMCDRMYVISEKMKENNLIINPSKQH